MKVFTIIVVAAAFVFATIVLLALVTRPAQGSWVLWVNGGGEQSYWRIADDSFGTFRRCEDAAGQLRLGSSPMMAQCLPAGMKP